MKRFVAIMCLSVLSIMAVSAQQSMWGGSGSVVALPNRIMPSDQVEISYFVTQSRGTGTGDFRCEVTGPGGVIHIAQKASSEWNNGKAAASFLYPNDFSGNDSVRASTKLRGIYYFQCYWYIAGYGVNGKVAASSGLFRVE